MRRSTIMTSLAGRGTDTDVPGWVSSAQASVKLSGFTNDLAHQLEVRTSDPLTGKHGEMYYNSSLEKLRVYLTDTWVDAATLTPVAADPGPMPERKLVVYADHVDQTAALLTVDGVGSVGTYNSEPNTPQVPAGGVAALEITIVTNRRAPPNANHALACKVHMVVSRNAAGTASASSTDVYTVCYTEPQPRFTVSLDASGNVLIHATAPGLVGAGTPYRTVATVVQHTLTES